MAGAVLSDELRAVELLDGVPELLEAGLVYVVLAHAPYVGGLADPFEADLAVLGLEDDLVNDIGCDRQEAGEGRVGGSRAHQLEDGHGYAEDDKGDEDVTYLPTVHVCTPACWSCGG